jgi:hypothetical protein
MYNSTLFFLLIYTAKMDIIKNIIVATLSSHNFSFVANFLIIIYIILTKNNANTNHAAIFNIYWCPVVHGLIKYEYMPIFSQYEIIFNFLNTFTIIPYIKL